MEFRYVYRRLEDVIGVPVTSSAPHIDVGRRLRHAFREQLDMSRHSELTALCLAAIGGNPSIDVAKITDRVSQILDRALDQKLPFLAPADTDSGKEKPDSGDTAYDEYFRQLDAMSKSMNSRGGNDGTNGDDDSGATGAVAIIQETA